MQITHRTKIKKTINYSVLLHKGKKCKLYFLDVCVEMKDFNRKESKNIKTA